MRSRFDRRYKGFPAARIDRLPADAKGLLQALAVIGRELRVA
jgi:hypothetical protein